MNANDALRFLAHESKHCRDRDAHEALCLLLPGIARVLNLRTMTAGEAAAFRREFKKALAGPGDSNQPWSRLTASPGPAVHLNAS